MLHQIVNQPLNGAQAVALRFRRRSTQHRAGVAQHDELGLGFQRLANEFTISLPRHVHLPEAEERQLQNGVQAILDLIDSWEPCPEVGTRRNPAETKRRDHEYGYTIGTWRSLPKTVRLDLCNQLLVLVGRLHGVIVAVAEVGLVWRNPQHVYTQQLLAAVTGVGEWCG